MYEYGTVYRSMADVGGRVCMLDASASKLILYPMGSRIALTEIPVGEYTYAVYPLDDTHVITMCRDGSNLIYSLE